MAVSASNRVPVRRGLRPFMRHVWLWSSCSAILAACVTAPEPIRTPVGGPTVAMVLQNPERYAAALVRWGGTIVETENRKTETWLEIVARRLERNGRPLATGGTPGRFIAKVPGFLEPELYQRGRDITVVGKLTDSLTRAIGEYPYRFPVVAVAAHYLWETAPVYEPLYDFPYYWDPFYYPWWPYYRYPYYRYRHY